MITDLTDATFEEFLASSELVLVDFWADWCPHCTMMAPILEQVAELLPDVAFAKVDTEKCPETAKRFEIEILPTFLIFSNGLEIARFTGSYGRGMFLELIEEAL